MTRGSDWRLVEKRRGSVDQRLGGSGQPTGGQGRQKQGEGVENPVPEPGAEDLNLVPDGRDLRPENYLSLAPAPALALIISAIDAAIFSQQ
jgi:hypothetical protein